MPCDIIMCLAMHCSDDSFPRNCKSSVSAAGILHALSHHHCLEGFAFPDGDVSKTSACSVVGIGVQWLPPLQDCQRKHLPLSFITKLFLNLKG